MNLRYLYLLSLIVAFASGIAIVDAWLDRVAAQQSAAPAAQAGVAVSVVDDAQQQAPQTAPAEPQPAYDRGALDARIGRALRGTLDPTPAPKSLPVLAAAPVPPAERKDVPLEQKIGQMLVFGFQGSAPEQKWPKAVARQLETGQLGGVIFLGYNLKNRKDARRLMRSFRDAGRKAALPPFFVLDQEGGQVQRLGPKVGVPRWPSHAYIARKTPNAARAHYYQMASVLKDWGFNVNLGPVTDVNVHRNNPIIGRLGRSFSSDPAKVTDFARIFIDAHRQNGIITSLKHFPGHGSSRKDSHLGFVDITNSWKKEPELRPFRDLIGSGRADMVMIGHLYLAQFQTAGAKRKYPATLSPEVVTGLLRKELGYNGVVISDDMEMGAIRKLYPTYEAAIRAILAGVDLLIVSNSAKPDIGLPGKYIAEIAKAARKDPRLGARIDESYARILALKQRLVSKKAQAPVRGRCIGGRLGAAPVSSRANNCHYSRTAAPARPVAPDAPGRPALVPREDVRG